MNMCMPPEIAHQVEVMLGPCPRHSIPGGMSGASVARLTGNGTSAILKTSTSEVEWQVYTRTGPRLREAGVPMPELLAHAASDGIWWLLLEDIPEPLPSGRMLADPAVLASLRSLHTVPPDEVDLPVGHYVPTWSEVMTQRALSLFPSTVARDLTPKLERFRYGAQASFEPRCLVSGDPNPANWGVRRDGSPVLFDWERITLASPEVDLAITVPGLGDMAMYARVSAEYAGNVLLAPDIARAKLWSVVEFLAGYADGDIQPSFDLESLIERIPPWISDLDAHL